MLRCIIVALECWQQKQTAQMYLPVVIAMSKLPRRGIQSRYDFNCYLVTQQTVITYNDRSITTDAPFYNPRSGVRCDVGVLGPCM